MTYQQTIEALKFYKEKLYNGIFKDKIEAFDVAISVLEKQIPKRPDFEGDGYDDGGNLIYDTWICPCCETKYEVDYEHHKHCPECGQKIDWSEDDE